MPKDMKLFAVGDLLTNEEAESALMLFVDDPLGFHKKFRDEFVVPNLERFKELKGQDNDPDYIAYAIGFAISSVIFNQEEDHAN